MLSEKVIALCKQILELNEELDRVVTEETNGQLGYCEQTYIQLWTPEELMLNKEQVEALVGPLDLTTVYAGDSHYRFNIGEAPARILLHMLDSRGEADAVCTEEKPAEAALIYNGQEANEECQPKQE